MKLLRVIESAIKLIFKYRKFQMYTNKKYYTKVLNSVLVYCLITMKYLFKLRESWCVLQLLFCKAITTIGFIKSVWNLLALALGLGPEPEESFTKGFINARLHTCTYRFVPRLHLENRTTEASRECGILQNLPCCDLSKTNVPKGKRRLFL